MAKKHGNGEGVNQDLADQCKLEWFFQSDAAFLNSVATLVSDEVGPVAQIRNLRSLQDTVEAWSRFLAALAEEVKEAREWDQANLRPDWQQMVEMMAEARRSCWEEKSHPAVLPVSPAILEQIRDE